MKKITLILCFPLFLLCFQAIAGTHGPDKNMIMAMPLPPLNDECASATVLTVNAGQACSMTNMAVFTAATISSQPNSCAAPTTPDIWFQFVATTDSHSVSLSNFVGTPQPVILALYEGSDCSTMTQLYCSANNVINATGLTIGETYKVRTYFNIASPSLATTFSICISTPPPPSDTNPLSCTINTINYSFEDPDATGPYPNMINQYTVQGWRTTATDNIMEFWPVPNYENVPAYEGNQFIELNANLVSGVYQDYETPQAVDFNFGFAHRGRQGTDTCELQAGPPGGPYLPVMQATTGNTAWVYYTGTYTVPVGQTQTRFILQSVSSVGGVSVGNYLDAISFTAYNGIITDSPYYMNCDVFTAEVSGAGIGTWSAHADNPSPTVIADPTANDTQITGFTVPGHYYFDWGAGDCTSTLFVIFTGVEPPAPDATTTVVYCQGQPAVPLVAEAEDGNTLHWYPSGPDGTAPTPNTASVGSTVYYVSQLTPSECESMLTAITVTVNGLGDSVTDFTLPDSVCEGNPNVTPSPAIGFTAGGEYTADSADLIIDPVSGEIDVAASAVGDYMVTYAVEANPDLCILNDESSTVPFSIVAPPAAPEMETTQPVCGTPTGTITITAPLGADLMYSIDNGGYWQTSNVFTGVAPGDYDIMVQNPQACQSTSGPVTIDPALPVPPIPSVDDQSPGCNEVTGSITVTAPVGTGYQYSLNGTDWQDDPLFDLIDPGTYTVYVVNSDGCENQTFPFVINDTPDNPPLAAFNITQPECDPTGSIVVTSPTGPGYSYSLNGVDYQTTTGFSGLTEGDYTVTVKNASGCTTVNDPITIDEPFEVPDFPMFTWTAISCGQTTTTLTITEPLGPNLEYSANGVDFQDSNVFVVTPGPHMITVRNTITGCESGNVPFSIPGAGNLPDVATYVVTPPTCTNPNGTITITAPVGTGLSYSLNDLNFQSSPVFNNVPPGEYIITVKNASQCKSYTLEFVINPGPPTPDPAEVTITQPTCAVQTGSIQVDSPLGGGHTYSVDGGAFQLSPSFTGLVPGLHIITVKNSDGCTASSNFTVNPAPPIPAVASYVLVNPGCDETTGSITVTAPLGGGAAYSIDGGATIQYSPVFDNLVPDDYVITVIGNSGCTSDTPLITVTTPPVPVNAGTITGDSDVCMDDTLQLANATAGGAWSVSNTGIATIDATGLITPVAPGTITVTYTMPAVCESITTKVVTVHALPNPVLVDTVLCLDAETGEYSLNVLDSGLDASYSFVWTKDGVLMDEDTAAITIDEPGDYIVTATNIDSGCVESATATVTTSSLAVAHAVVGNDFDFRQTINVVVTSGTGDYEFSLNGGPWQDEPYFNNIYEGEYTITIRDKNGCGEGEILYVYALNYPRFFSPNGDGQHEVWNIDGLLGQQDAVIHIFDRYGKIVGSAKPGIAGWDGSYEGADLPATDYWFVIHYTSSDGTKKEYKAHFSLLR